MKNTKFDQEGYEVSKNSALFTWSFLGEIYMIIFALYSTSITFLFFVGIIELIFIPFIVIIPLIREYKSQDYTLQVLPIGGLFVFIECEILDQLEDKIIIKSIEGYTITIPKPKLMASIQELYSQHYPEIDIIWVKRNFLEEKIKNSTE